MLKEYRTQTQLCAWGGIVFLGFAYFMGGLADDGWRFFSRLLVAGGYALTGCGTYMYGRGKGYAVAVGFLGLLGPAGLLVVYVLRDRSGVVLRQRVKERRSRTS